MTSTMEERTYSAQALLTLSMSDIIVTATKFFACLSSQASGMRVPADYFHVPYHPLRPGPPKMHPGAANTHSIRLPPTHLDACTVDQQMQSGRRPGVPQSSMLAALAGIYAQGRYSNYFYSTPHRELR